MSDELKNTSGTGLKQWYIVQVVAGREKKVKEDLENRDFNDVEIEEFFLPTVVYKTKTGNTRLKAMHPGYLYLKVEMTDESWFIIRNTNYVTGIVGSSGKRTKPTPVRESEIEKMKAKAREEELKMKNIEIAHEEKSVILDAPYEIGDLVRIKGGEFGNSQGTVTSISLESQKTSVQIEFFGRMLEVQVDINGCEKI